MVKITGVELADKIAENRLRLKALNTQFQGSLMRFEGETKRTPESIDEEISKLERIVIGLQQAQTRYNLQVKVKVQGQEMTLLEVVRAIGPAGRREKMWRDLVSPKPRRWDPENRGKHARNKDTVYATPAVGEEDAYKIATRALKDLSRLKSAVKLGNAQEIEIEIDPKLLE